MTTLHSVAPQGAGGLKSEHYPNLELCRKLTEAGFPETEKFMKDTNGQILSKNLSVYTSDFYNRLVCPSVMELLDEMPIIINDDKQLYLVKHEDLNYSVKYWSKNWGSDFGTFNTLPNALAEMWLWLKENNYLTK